MVPDPLAGSAVDGSKTVHAASVYYPDQIPPAMDKSKYNALFYVGDDRWELRSDEKLLRTSLPSLLPPLLVERQPCSPSQLLHR